MFYLLTCSGDQRKAKAKPGVDIESNGNLEAKPTGNENDAFTPEKASPATAHER